MATPKKAAHPGSPWRYDKVIDPLTLRVVGKNLVVPMLSALSLTLLTLAHLTSQEGEAHPLTSPHPPLGVSVGVSRKMVEL